MNIFPIKLIGKMVSMPHNFSMDSALMSIIIGGLISFGSALYLLLIPKRGIFFCSAF